MANLGENYKIDINESQSDLKLSKSFRTPLSKFGIFLLVTLVIVGVIIGIGLVIIYATGSPENDGVKEAPKSCVGEEKVYTEAAVNSDAAFCSNVGKDLMKRGGSAIDAAIATLVCIGIENPQSCGLGGGFLMTYYNRPTKELMAIDSREVAPLAATTNMYVGKGDASWLGPLSIAISGDVYGFWDAHRRFGKLPWKDLFTPSIKMCKDGWPMGYKLHKEASKREAMLLTKPGFRSWLINDNTGKVFKEGDIIKRPWYVKTLEQIANGGAEAFYNGSLADDIIADLKDVGSIITKADLEKYFSRIKKAISVTLKNGDVFGSLPPPSSGAIVAFVLNIIDGYGLKPSDFSSDPVSTYHKILEAQKFAYARRSELGDDAFVDVKELLKNLTSTDYANEIRSLITDKTHDDPSYYGQSIGQISKTGTCHVSVIGPDGSAVGVTDTTNYYFGSKVVGARTNIIFNNEMDDFSTPNTTNLYGYPASPTNFIKPGKRPMSSMSPSILVDKNGNVIDVVGSAGGSKIISSILWILIRVRYLGQSLKEASDAARFHNQWSPDVVQYEDGVPKDVLDGLQAKGHKLLKVDARSIAISQPLHVDGEGIHAYSDIRKRGCPAGYEVKNTVQQ